MIEFNEALEIVLNSAIALDSEKIYLNNSLNRVLAEDIIADMNMPPFDKSAMDGYACRYEDITNPLKVIEVIPAGKVPQKNITKNKCSKIMTGAMLPKGADCVIMVEHTKNLEPDIIQYTKEAEKFDISQLSLSQKKQLNICYLGEDIKKGELVIKKGIIIKPQDIATMASLGYSEVLVSKKPKIAVIPTGNEIVEPEITPSVSQIRNSNGPQLIAQLKKTEIDAKYYGIAKDSRDETKKLLKKAFNENDIVLLTGGVSKGDFDLIPDILEEMQFKILFRQVAVQPGKPVVFAKNGDKLCFGLPGNPVSAYVQFEILVKPIIYGCMGANYKPLEITLPIANEYSRKKDKRLSLLPAMINSKGEAELLDYHGSAHISGYSGAWGLLSVPKGIKELKKGDLANVRQI